MPSRTYSLPYGVEIEVAARKVAIRDCGQLTAPEFDGILSMIGSHASSGIDVRTTEYKNGIVAAVEATIQRFNLELPVE